jgi:ubiquinol-cytochrome c reductase iron-sulfur subunit
MAEGVKTAGAPQAAGAGEGEGGTRRDFLFLTTAAVMAYGVAAVAWPLIDQMNPAADVLALASTEVDISQIQAGQRVTVSWRGMPVFIDHRTPEQIESAESANLRDLPDPEPDSARVKKADWLVVVGICTHLGCVPKGQRIGEPRGEYGGWFCPCHGSVYDTSGRIRYGPAPRNLEVPPYEFVSDTVVRIG